MAFPFTRVKQNVFYSAPVLGWKPNFSVDGKNLTRVAEYKYLGVILPLHAWNAHNITYVLGKAWKRIGMLGRSRPV